MKKIVFVCLGNICRSPMAEFMFKDMVKKAGREKDFLIESRATSDEAAGCDVHRGTQEVLHRYGIPWHHRRAVRFEADDYYKYDLIITMESANNRALMRTIKQDTDNKVHKLLEFSGINRDIADPWYTGDFDATFKDIKEGLEGLLKQL